MKEAICVERYIYGMQTEYRDCPIGIDTHEPRFSWKLFSDTVGEAQTAYSITVATDNELKNTVFMSGKVENDISYGIEYKGEKLQSATRYYWAVSVYDKNGDEITSPTAYFETGLYDESDWRAVRIGLDSASSAEQLRREFIASKPIKSARLYATALGLYTASINSSPISADYLAPGWTDYDKRVQYAVYDVTDLVSIGKNAIAVTLGNGWFSGHFSCCNYYYGKAPSFFGQLLLNYDDGTSEIIASDEQWRGYGKGPYVADDLQNGVIYDARNEAVGWDMPDFDDSEWEPVRVLPWISDITGEPLGKLCAQPCAPIRAVERITPISVDKIGDVYVVDMGQNFAGVAEIKIPACKAGTEITFKFAEIKTKSGNIDMGNLGSAEQTDRFISNGAAALFSPQFTYHGFQYIEVSGYPEKLGLNDITGLALSTDINYHGSFICSDERINKIVRNTYYSQLSNFTSVPTDCPQRSERSGWLGDIRIFGAAAAYNADIACYIAKYLRDVYDAANPKTGALPDVAPKTTRYEGSLEGHAAWGDAGVALPWLLYTVYGDKRILEQGYEYCKKWVQYYLDNSDDYIYTHTKGEYNDWLNCNEGTPGNLVGTAYFKYSADLMTKIATAIGKTEDAAYFADLAVKVSGAFADKYIEKQGYYAGRVGNDSEASYILALGLDLVPLELYEKVKARHLHLLESRRFRTYNGYSSINFLLPELTDTGYAEYAYNCLFNRSLPGWLWFADAGLTTMPESWWGTPSRNHYVFGCVCEWLYKYVAGIDNGNCAAYKHIYLHPTLDTQRRLTFANAKTETVFGVVESGWTLNENGSYTYKVSIPANTTATVRFPLANVYFKGNPIELISSDSGIISVDADQGELVCDIVSGSYEFVMNDAKSDSAIETERLIGEAKSSDISSIELAREAFEELSIAEQLTVDNYYDLIRTHYEHIYAYADGEPDEVCQARVIASRIDSLPDLSSITLADADYITELFELYSNAQSEVAEQVYNADILILAAVIINNLPDENGAEHVLELVNPEGPEGCYYALRAGEKIYAGDSIKLDASKPIKYGDYEGTVLNFSKLNNWNDIFDRELFVKVDERNKVEAWCMTLELEGGAKDIVVKLGEFEVHTPHTASDILDAVEVNAMIAELEDCESDIEYYKSAVEPVRRAYDSLHKDVRYLVENVARLDRIESPYIHEVAKEISRDIDNLPELCYLTADDRKKVEFIRERANKLGQDAELLIKSYKRLCDSELVIKLYPTPKRVKLEVASRVGPEGKYLKVPSGVTLYNGDSIVVPYSADYTYKDTTSSIINLAFEADWQRAWQYDYPALLREPGKVGVYCLTMHPGNKNTTFKLVDLEVAVKYTAQDIADAIKLRDEIESGSISANTVRARYEALHPDIRDIILHI